MKIGLIGDLHGNPAWSVYAINRLANEGIKHVIQLGDFGIGLGDPRFVRNTNIMLSKNNMRMLVVPGNHEDYDQIEKLETWPDGLQQLTDHIFFLPRGHRFELGGKSFVALGGAPSVDRAYRLQLEREARLGGKERKLWWAQEQMTREDVDKTVAGGYADVMLGHDAPFTETIQKQIGGNPHGFELEDIQYAHEGRVLIDEAASLVRPKLFLHGHYHFPVYDAVTWSDGSQGMVVGLDADQSANSFAILDTDTMAVEVLPLQREGFLIQNGRTEKQARDLVRLLDSGRI